MNSAVVSSVRNIILNQTKKSLHVTELHQASYQMYWNFAFCAGSYVEASDIKAVICCRFYWTWFFSKYWCKIVV